MAVIVIGITKENQMHISHTFMSQAYQLSWFAQGFAPWGWNQESDWHLWDRLSLLLIYIDLLTIHELCLDNLSSDLLCFAFVEFAVFSNIIILLWRSLKIYYCRCIIICVLSLASCVLLIFVIICWCLYILVLSTFCSFWLPMIYSRISFLFIHIWWSWIFITL